MNERNLNDWLTCERTDIAGDRLRVEDGRGVLIHRDYGADVLAVAHLDTVGEPYGPPERPKWRNRYVVQHTGLDDRLGAWAITNMVRRGLKVDVLFTDCEETARTTGADFMPPRPYKLILSLDRKGTDCVLYRYHDTRAWRRMCNRWLGPVEYGSFSCIDSMSHLGICGVNIGVGYYCHNSAQCWADLRVTRMQMRRATRFVEVARQRTWRYHERARYRYEPPRSILPRAWWDDADNGRRYQDLVADTLDLDTRAWLSEVVAADKYQGRVRK